MKIINAVDMFARVAGLVAAVNTHAMVVIQPKTHQVIGDFGLEVGVSRAYLGSTPKI